MTSSMSLSSTEATYLENVVSEAKTALNLTQLQKDRKSAVELTEKVNQATKGKK